MKPTLALLLLLVLFLNFLLPGVVCDHGTENDIEFFYGRHEGDKHHHSLEDYYKLPPSFGVPAKPQHPLKPYMPCVWSSDQLVDLAPREIWDGGHEHDHNSAPYQLCQMKLRYLELYDRRIRRDSIGHWYNLSAEYLMFRLNRELGDEFHYTTIPGPHDSVEHDITELLKLKCMNGYCNDFHVDINQCGGKLYGVEYIYSNFYYVHLSMYSEGILRLHICNAPVEEEDDEEEDGLSDRAQWLDELLHRVAHEDRHEYHEHGLLHMVVDPVLEMAKSSQTSMAVTIGIVVLLMVLGGILVSYSCMSRAPYPSTLDTVKKTTM